MLVSNAGTAEAAKLKPKEIYALHKLLADVCLSFGMIEVGENSTINIP